MSWRVRDLKDNVVIICSIEFRPMGGTPAFDHGGPGPTLSDKEYQACDASKNHPRHRA